MKILFMDVLIKELMLPGFLQNLHCLQCNNKKSQKTKSTSQEEPDIIYDLPLPHQQAIELQINTAYEHINKHKM